VTHYFLDSSALIKRYVAEQGTSWIRSIILPTAGNTITVAQITQIETFSGISRRKREGVIPDRTVQAIWFLLDRHIKREYEVVELSDFVVQRAKVILDKHPLRAYDSIQLASAFTANTDLVSSGLSALVFVSADVRLLASATAEGLVVDDPNGHP
jgi:predicted nucleic acid-binding protein